MQTALPTPFKLSKPKERLVDQEIKNTHKGATEVLKHSENQLHCTQKRWYQKARHELKAAKSVCEKSSFKMENLTQLQSVF